LRASRRLRRGRLPHMVQLPELFFDVAHGHGRNSNIPPMAQLVSGKPLTSMGNAMKRNATAQWRGDLKAGKGTSPRRAGC
jgi:hypothetical protein